MLETDSEDEAPSTNPFDVADEPIPEEEPVIGTAAGSGRASAESASEDTDASGGGDRLPGHDPDGTHHGDRASAPGRAGRNGLSTFDPTCR